MALHTTTNTSSAKFYTSFLTTLGYIKYSVGFSGNSLIITNDGSAGVVKISYDGTNLHGELNPNETLTMDLKNAIDIWIKGSVIDIPGRIFGW